MMVAARQLLGDFLSTIVFLAAYGLLGSVPVAVGVAIAVALGQFGFLKFKGVRLDAMQWISLGIVLVLGGATLLTANAQFILVKPAIVHFVIGAVMLRRGWMIRYLPPRALERLPESAIIAAGYAWAALMWAIGFAILVIAFRFDLQVWAWFNTVGVMGLQIGAFLLQYAVLRAIGRRRASISPTPSRADGASG